MFIEDLLLLLQDLGLEKLKVTGDNVMFNCPFHGERNPSAGIHVEKLCGQCFACGEKFTLHKLVAHCLNIPEYKAIVYLEERFNTSFKNLNIQLNEEEDNKLKRFTLPNYYIAPFKSGKIFHQYMLNRGFTKDIMQEFKFGWDKEKMRVTIPIFYENGNLGGVIGRAVLDDKINGKINPDYIAVYGKSPKYYIYEKAPVSEMLFPLNKVEVIDNTIVLVEGTLDAVWMYQNGFRNVLATFSNKIFINNKKVYNQLYYLYKLGVKSVILMRDNDEAGIEGSKHDYNILKWDFKVYKVDYLDERKDPQSYDKKELEYMINNANYYNTIKLRKII